MSQMQLPHPLQFHRDPWTVQIVRFQCAVYPGERLLVALSPALTQGWNLHQTPRSRLSMRPHRKHCPQMAATRAKIQVRAISQWSAKGAKRAQIFQFDRAGSARLPQRPRRRELKSDQKCLWHQNQLRPQAARTRRTRRPSTQQERQTQLSQQVPPHQTPHLRKRYPQTPRMKLLAQMLVQL